VRHQIENYEIDLTPIYCLASQYISIAQRSGAAANTHRNGDLGEAWCSAVQCGVVWCVWMHWLDWMEGFSGTEILNSRRVDAACGALQGEASEGSGSGGSLGSMMWAGDYPCNYNYNTVQQSTVRNVLYFSFLSLRMLMLTREQEKHMLTYSTLTESQLDSISSSRVVLRTEDQHKPKVLGAPTADPTGQAMKPCDAQKDLTSHAGVCAGRGMDDGSEACNTSSVPSYLSRVADGGTAT
jgi:hypothetical protein